MYQYKAYTLDKKIVEGTIDSPNEDSAEESLLEAGYRHVLSLKKKRSPFHLRRVLPRLFGAGKPEVIDFFNQLATLLDSGMPVIQAMWLLAEQSSGAAMKRFIHKLGEELAAGGALSGALSHYPRLVTVHYCQVIKVSEESGNLTRGLRLVAGYMENETSMSGKLTRMLSYPAFLAFMAVIVIMVLATVTMPSLVQLFDSLSVELPLSTRILVGLSEFISEYRFYIPAAILGMLLLGILAVRSAHGRRVIDSITYRLPVVGSIIRLRNISRFCRSSGMLIEAGLTLPQVINTVKGTVDSKHIQQTLTDIRRQLVQGQGLAQPMADSGVFPRLLVDMVRIGERTGTMQASLSTMADFYEKKLEQRVQRLLSMIEPASIIIVGLVISLIGIAIVTPLYTIYQTIY
jgi:type IV pilus assembly protein PilC